MPSTTDTEMEIYGNKQIDLFLSAQEYYRE